jgi:hypothetical protein
MDLPKQLVSDFALLIGSTNERVALENAFRVLEVDLVVAQVVCALLLAPSKTADAGEQLTEFVFPHWKSPVLATSGMRGLFRLTGVYIQSYGCCQFACWREPCGFAAKTRRTPPIHC